MLAIYDFGLCFCSGTSSCKIGRKLPEIVLKILQVIMKNALLSWIDILIWNVI